MVIYPVDSVIHFSTDNRGQITKRIPSTLLFKLVSSSLNLKKETIGLNGVQKTDLI